MSKKILFICIYILCLVSLFFSKRYIDNIEKINAWYISSVYADTDKKIERLKELKQGGNSWATYYLADIYKNIDIEQSIRHATQYLQNSNGDTMEIYLIHLLLGELYFYLRDYEKSAEHYWIALKHQSLNDDVRYNYELAYYYLHNMSPHTNKNIEQVIFERYSSTTKKKVDPLPKSLEHTINQSKSFKYYVKENNASTGKQW